MELKFTIRNFFKELNIQNTIILRCYNSKLNINTLIGIKIKYNRKIDNGKIVYMYYRGKNKTKYKNKD